MKLDLGDQSFPIPCPQCSEKIDEKIGRLKHNPKLTCPHCGASIKVDAHKLRREIKSIQKLLDDFGRSLKKFFK